MSEETYIPRVGDIYVQGKAFYGTHEKYCEVLKLNFEIGGDGHTVWFIEDYKPDLRVRLKGKPQISWLPSFLEEWEYYGNVYDEAIDRATR